MQSNIRSFFQPLARVKSEKEETEDSHMEDVLISQKSFFQPLARVKSEKEETEDSHMEDVLISQKKFVNGSELCEDFTVNSASKKSPKVIKSENEEDSVELDGKDAQADDNTLNPDCAPEPKISEESPSTSPTTSNSTTSGSIPRRKTARKQLSKRKPEEDDNSYYSHENHSSKRRKEDLDGNDSKDKTKENPTEIKEVKSENVTLVEHKTDEYAKEKEIRDSVKPPCKSISSFFAPKKSSVKIEKKQAPVVSENMPVPKCHNKVSNDESNNMVDNTLSSLHMSAYCPQQSRSSFYRSRKDGRLSQPSANQRQTPAYRQSFLKPSLKHEPAEYNPTKSSYHPVHDACWDPGQKIPYMAVARTLEYIEEESARLKIIETLSNFFRSAIVLSPQDLLPCVYLCLNRLGPAYEGLELGIGKTILMKALAQATGRQLDQIKAEAAEKGDLGVVAENSRTTQGTVFAPPKLSAAAVFGKLQAIGHMAGSSSLNKKIDIIKSLFVACRHSEARYVARSLEGKLRIGLAEQSVLSALAQAASLTPPGQKFPPDVLDAAKGKSTDARKAWLDERVLIVKQAFCELPNYDIIVPALLEHGVESLPQYCKITPGIPLKPMLAHPTKGIGEVLKRFEEAAFTCEYKYDGERAQIHILENGEVHIYSRNQENNTTKYPDIVTRIPKVKISTVKSCILDAEAVAWDPVSNQILPFQVLTTRKRKDVDAAEIRVQVCIYAFDMLYLNGMSLVQKPLSQRRILLHNSFTEVEGQFLFATFMDTSNVDEIAEFLEHSIKDSCEGLMIKTLEVNATYEIAKRSHNWLKLKKDYLEGVGDTLDLVVIGAYLGKGKRAGTYGGFLLACYDEESEEFQSICKVGTGFSDEDLVKLHNSLKDYVIPQPRQYYRWGGTAEPDHWLESQHVWEVKCADLSISPIHRAAAGLVDEEKGISLRFPRFLRIRDDKKPEEATSSVEVAELYRKQQYIQNQMSLEKDDDFY